MVSSLRSWKLYEWFIKFIFIPWELSVRFKIWSKISKLKKGTITKFQFMRTLKLLMRPFLELSEDPKTREFPCIIYQMKCIGPSKLFNTPWKTHFEDLHNTHLEAGEEMIWCTFFFIQNFQLQLYQNKPEFNYFV